MDGQPGTPRTTSNTIRGAAGDSSFRAKAEGEPQGDAAACGQVAFLGT
jgi:hypothetical protein